jgi:hypothetical protein
LLLARAVNPEQSSRIGNQTGGRVFLFLHTDNFWRDYREMTARGVKAADRQANNHTELWQSLKISTATSGICCN